MLTLSSSLQNALDSAVTTLCWGWRVVRRDGLVFGFSDHDRDLEIDGLTYFAGSGFGGAGLERADGLTPGQADLAGALDALVLREADLEAGLWSGAMIELWRIDWTQPDERVRVATGELGEVRRRDGRFEAEWLGPSHRLERTVGRVFSRRCDAVLGDERCTVAASHPEYANGCDGAFSTCGERFANRANFRGFPYMIGNDVLIAAPDSETRRDGGSRGLGR